MWHTCTQPSWLPYRLTYYNIPVLNASWLPYRLTYYNIPILNASWLPYKLAYYNSNVLKFFLEGVIDPFHLEYFIKTFVQANHPRFKLELKCIFLKRGQNVGEFVFVVWNHNHWTRVISKYGMPLQVLLCRNSGYCVNEFETYHTITIGDTGQLTN